MRECHVLPPKLSALLPALRTLIESLSIRTRLPQIEVAIGERLTPAALAGEIAWPTTASIDPSRPRPGTARLRAGAAHPRELSTADEAKLVAFADAHGVEFWLQSGGPETVVPFYPPSAALAYTLPEFDVALPFAPTDFTQVNSAINRVLVRRAVQLLGPQPGERIGDFFCGLGNFTLPIARSGRPWASKAASRWSRARRQFGRNGLGESTRFGVANLFTVEPPMLEPLGPLDRG